MKKARMILMLAAMLAAALLMSAALGEMPEPEDEWTVLFYLCGSDLESKYSYASGNLEDISQVIYPDNILDYSLKQRGLSTEEALRDQPGKVNVLIETGGSREWHTQELGMEIDPGALQRWSYNTYSMFDVRESELYPRNDGFELMETLPLQSMSDPGTLADFIRWGIQARPAKKYALVLWDHGDGARTGLFIDELFEGDIMYLYELRQALADGGAHFEAVIIDACLMASIETAWNIRDHASWMVASEEIVPGEGTAMGEWLQQLMCYPEGDGEWLGRCVCDATAVKYANEASEEAKSILTWSVTDLSKVDALIDSAGQFFQDLGDMLRTSPYDAALFIRYLYETAQYGDGQQHMRDFGSLVYNTDMALFARRSTRSAAIQALSDAVVYCVGGPGRPKARGLTFCYPAGFTDGQLDIYARNFPMHRYLAYLDALSDWTAPDWVYEKADRLPEIDEIPEMQIEVRKAFGPGGMPGLVVSHGMTKVIRICYTLYRKNKESGETVRLGSTNCGIESMENENFELLWRATDPMHWPSVEGKLMCMDLIQIQDDWKLYNVPVMIDSRPGLLRMGRQVNYAEEESERINNYEVYGLWEGYEENSILLNRSVKPLSALAGQEFQMLYPIDGTGNGSPTLYQSSEPLTMYRALDVQEIPLSPGTYYLEFEVDDIFLRRTAMDRIEIYWDGQSITFPEGETWADGAWINLARWRDR